VRLSRLIGPFLGGWVDAVDPIGPGSNSAASYPGPSQALRPGAYRSISPPRPPRLAAKVVAASAGRDAAVEMVWSAFRPTLPAAEHRRWSRLMLGWMPAPSPRGRRAARRLRDSCSAVSVLPHGAFAIRGGGEGGGDHDLLLAVRRPPHRRRPPPPDHLTAAGQPHGRGVRPVGSRPPAPTTRLAAAPLSSSCRRPRSRRGFLEEITTLLHCRVRLLPLSEDPARPIQLL